MASRRPAKAPAPRTPRVDPWAILESAGAIVYAHDLQGRFLYVNGHASEALGFDAADAKRLVGRSHFDVLAPHAVADAAVVMRRGMGRPLDVNTFRLDVRRKDGSAVTLEISARPLWQRGKVLGRVGVGRIVDDASSAGAAVVERAVVEERQRIAHALRERIADVVLELATEDPAANGRDTSRAADILRRHGLDDTDRAIVRLVIEGASNPEIGRQVHLSLAAVKDRIARLMRRLGARRRAELSAQALRAGII
jgi:PAS domain S-box-containing protein